MPMCQRVDFLDLCLRNELVIKRILICILFFAYCPMVFAGAFFNVLATGPAARISLTLCLNGQGPLSCQNYTVSASNLTITTTIPNHTYPNVGIKINTPGYVPTGCSMNSKGYCLFSVSNTTAATIPVTSTTCQSQADLIVFSPVVTQVNNPTGSTPNASQQFSINMTMCNSQGQALIPSPSNPVHVNVYGAPNGVISPTSTTTSTGLITFTYSGQSFPNNILINAWISDSTNNGVALGQTQVLQQNPLSCSYSPTFYDVPLTQTLPNPLQIQADVGYSTTSPTSTLTTYTLDTGSLGVIVPASELPKNANVIGPGPAGVTYYDSSGNTFSGNYYLAPVRVKTSSETVMTQPIMVLAINKAYCSGPPSASCYSGIPPTPNLHYIGVGFNRSGGVPPGDTTLPNLFRSPTANAFLHITNNNNGIDVTPGYYLKPGDSGAPTGLTLGIHSTTNYNLFNLTPNPAVPGDFLTEYGCYGFTNITTPVTFCGTLLLDVGIDQMFIELPRAQWPAGTYESNNKVPVTLPPINMSITAGTANQMSYTFDVVQTCPSSIGPNAVAPCFVQWIDSTATGQIFVNTGRRALYEFDYLYQGQCGQVGFYQY
jgi:hypothetical protein